MQRSCAPYIIHTLLWTKPFKISPWGFFFGIIFIDLRYCNYGRTVLISGGQKKKEKTALTSDGSTFHLLVLKLYCVFYKFWRIAWTSHVNSSVFHVSVFVGSICKSCTVMHTYQICFNSLNNLWLLEPLISVDLGCVLAFLSHIL